MKKKVLFAAALVAALSANAQTFVISMEQSPSSILVIPDHFTSDGQGRLLFQEGDWEDPLPEYRIFNNQLQLESTLTIECQTITYFNYWINADGSVYDGDEDGITMINKPLEPFYADVSNGRGSWASTSKLPLSQTLFNATSSYEYLMRVFSGTYSYLESNNTRHILSKCLTINIMGTDGNVHGTITSPDGYSFTPNLSYLLKMGNNVYIVFGVRSMTSGSDYYAWYRIDQQSQSVALVETTPMSVRPTVANRGQDITVELGDGTQASELEVVNALGQTVKRVPVQPGQREVRINTADLGHGMNLISSRKQGAVKIIVK